MSKRHRKYLQNVDDDLPVEIPMTDLGWSEEGDEADKETNDSHAAGTPGGGAASGGLAGTNVGHGDPDNVDLEDALGSGLFDTAGESEGEAPYAGPSGGAVGGTPAEKRVKGGHRGDRLGTGKSRPFDSTLGAPSQEKY